MDGDFGDAVELHFGSMAPGGYAWVFPRKEVQILDLESRQELSKGISLNSLADQFISKYQGEITFRGAGSLPMSGTIQSFVKGSHLLVGDSAGMVLPSNGAGITIAMIGGRIAGQKIVSHLENGTSLHEYEIEWKRQMGSVMRNSKLSFKIGSWIMRLTRLDSKYGIQPSYQAIRLEICDLSQAILHFLTNQVSFHFLPCQMVTIPGKTTFARAFSKPSSPNI